MDKFKTLKNKIESEPYSEKGSRFIGLAFPVKSIDDVEPLLELCRTKHPKASHYCYAYRLADSQETYRANDDGEPNGSAGLPILNQIKSFELHQVLVVVLRYYGGQKLGVSGLIKAYKTGAQLALEKAVIVEEVAKEQFNLAFPYSFEGKVNNILKANRAEILHRGFNESVLYKIQIPKENLNLIKSFCEQNNQVKVISD